MKQTRSCVLILSLLISFAQADGIPVDSKTGRVTQPHVRLKLTEQQLVEMRDARLTRRITLNDDQHTLLKKRCEVFPPRIDEVLSYRYGDCTCCIGHPYAILLPDGRSFAVLNSEIIESRYGVVPRPNIAALAAQYELNDTKPSFWKRLMRVFGRD